MFLHECLVQLRHNRSGSRIDLDSKCHCLALQTVFAVIIREFQIQRYSFTFLMSDQTRFKTIDKTAASNSQILFFCRSPVKSLAIYFSGIIDVDRISILDSCILIQLFICCCSIKIALDLRIHIRYGNGIRRYSKALILSYFQIIFQVVIFIRHGRSTGSKSQYHHTAKQPRNNSFLHEISPLLFYDTPFRVKAFYVYSASYHPAQPSF